MGEATGKSEGFSSEVSNIFAVFNEIGIINQLASTLFYRCLPDGVTIAQFSILNHLIRVRDGQTPLALSSAFQMPKTSITHSLAELERRALIRSESNPKDRRSKCIWLTDAGRMFRDDAIAALAPDLQRLEPQMGKRELSALLPELARLRAILDGDRSA